MGEQSDAMRMRGRACAVEPKDQSRFRPRFLPAAAPPAPKGFRAGAAASGAVGPAAAAVGPRAAVTLRFLDAPGEAGSATTPLPLADACRGSEGKVEGSSELARPAPPLSWLEGAIAALDVEATVENSAGLVVACCDDQQGSAASNAQCPS